MKVCSGERKRINICTARARLTCAFLKAAKLPVKSARSALLRDPCLPIVVQIRSRDQSPRRNSGIESTVNNSSIAHSRISISLFLSLSPSLLAIFFFPFFSGATWLSLVDAVLTRQPRSVRQFTPRPFCLPRSFFFLSFPLPFFVRHRKCQREHKPPGPGDGIHRTEQRKGDARPL